MTKINKKVRKVIYNNWGKASIQRKVESKLNKKEKNIRFKHD